MGFFFKLFAFHWLFQRLLENWVCFLSYLLFWVFSWVFRRFLSPQVCFLSLFQNFPQFQEKTHWFIEKFLVFSKNTAIFCLIIWFINFVSWWIGQNHLNAVNSTIKQLKTQFNVYWVTINWLPIKLIFWLTFIHLFIHSCIHL